MCPVCSNRAPFSGSHGLRKGILHPSDLVNGPRPDVFGPQDHLPADWLGDAPGNWVGGYAASVSWRDFCMWIQWRPPHACPSGGFTANCRAFPTHAKSRVGALLCVARRAALPRKTRPSANIASCVRSADPRSRVRGPARWADWWTDDRLRPPQGQRASYSDDAGRGLARVLDSCVWASSHTPTSAWPDRVGCWDRPQNHCGRGAPPPVVFGGAVACRVSNHQWDADTDCGAGWRARLTTRLQTNGRGAFTADWAVTNESQADRVPRGPHPSRSTAHSRLPFLALARRCAGTNISATWRARCHRTSGKNGPHLCVCSSTRGERRPPSRDSSVKRSSRQPPPPVQSRPGPTRVLRAPPHPHPPCIQLPPAVQRGCQQESTTPLEVHLVATRTAGRARTAGTRCGAPRQARAPHPPPRLRGATLSKGRPCSAGQPRPSSDRRHHRRRTSWPCRRHARGRTPRSRAAGSTRPTWTGRPVAARRHHRTGGAAGKRRRRHRPRRRVHPRLPHLPRRRFPPVAATI